MLEERLARALDGLPDVTVGRQVAATEDDAVRSGMHGSPTILIDGVDPFAAPGQSAGVSCRLYRDSDGRGRRPPSVSQLRQAFRGSATAEDDAAGPSWLDALGRAGRGRIASAEGGLRAVHQAVLRSLSATGRAPQPESLDAAAAPFGAECCDGVAVAVLRKDRAIPGVMPPAGSAGWPARDACAVRRYLSCPPIS